MTIHDTSRQQTFTERQRCPGYLTLYSVFLILAAVCVLFRHRFMPCLSLLVQAEVGSELEQIQLASLTFLHLSSWARYFSSRATHRELANQQTQYSSFYLVAK